MSRRHASFDVAGHSLRLLDLGSTNGTTVNGVTVVEAVLHGGELVGIGESTLLVERQASTQPRVTSAVNFGRVIGASVAMRRLYRLCESLAASDLPVVIEGETGTGKELLAEELHNRGPRKEKPFVVLDCTAVASALVEGILFGEVMSSSTSTRGVFEAAHEGTLLIDEITELPAAIQGKFLRAVERGEIRQVGAEQPRRVDVRVLATTRRDLEKEVELGRFREDLFFRLSAARIELPPLRRRQGDVAILADYFARQISPQRGLPPDFLRHHEGYRWPGNVRELQNAVSRRLAIGDDELEPEEDVGETAPEAAFAWLLEQDLPFPNARDAILAEFEQRYVARVLAQHGGNVSRAAEASGLARRYFQIIRARRRH